MTDLELRRKLAELAGWEYLKEVHHDEGDFLIGRHPSLRWESEQVPAYEESLDAQARDLWPLLRERGLSVTLTSDQYASVVIFDTAKHSRADVHRSDSPYPEAEAVARAIVEVLREVTHGSNTR